MAKLQCKIGVGASARGHRAPRSTKTMLPLVLALALGACSSGASSPGPSASTSSPAALASLPDSTRTNAVATGKLEKATALETAGGIKRWKVTFTSQLRDTSSAEVTGLVFVPDRPAPVGGWPVVSYAHATVGLADACAPSGHVGMLEITLAGLFAAQNFAVVMSDYPGLGTPGAHLFLDGPSAGNSVVDIVKAAKQIEGVSLSDRTVFVGHSQGGHAALFAAEVAAARAPELKILGVVAGAPPSQLSSLVSKLITSKRSGYGVLVAKSLAAANPTLQLDQVLTPAGMAVSERLDTQCSDRTQDDSGTTALFKSADLPQPWLNALAKNEPGTKKFAAPVFLFHGDADDLVPVESSATLANRMKSLGIDVERKVYPGANHTSVVFAALGDITAWVTARAGTAGSVTGASSASTASSVTQYPGATGMLRALLERGAVKPLVIAHAGGDLEAPHSTPYAFDRAIKLGSDVLEMDVRSSKDGRVIVFHDPTVDRTTNDTGLVGDRTLAQLQKLDSANWFSPGCWDCRSDTTKTFPYRGVRAGRVTPPAGYGADDFAVVELATLLAKYRDTVFDIEIKADGPEGGAAVAAALAKLLLADDHPDRFIVVSFDDAALAAFRRDAPSIATSPGLTEISKYVLAGAKLSPTPLLQVPPELGGLPVFTEELHRRATADGMAIWVWPSDSETDDLANYVNILAGKPNGIIAGRPSALRKLLVP